MRPQQKIFRIETYQKNLSKGESEAVPAGDDALAAARHAELLRAIENIKVTVQPSDDQADSESSEAILKEYRAQIEEANQLKHELREMYAAIDDTKKEIATLHVTGFKSDEMSRVADELDAIVVGTETATETILTAAEDIDQQSATLIANLRAEANQGMVDDIQQDVIKIFEACNFQDLTGQRISKVVNTMRFIEDRIKKMIDIWGGTDSFEHIEPDQMDKPEGDASLLNGPALESDENTADQGDIDALFD